MNSRRKVGAKEHGGSWYTGHGEPRYDRDDEKHGDQHVRSNTVLSYLTF